MAFIQLAGGRFYDAGNPSTGEAVLVAGAQGCAAVQSSITRTMLDNSSADKLAMIPSILPALNGDIYYTTGDMIVRIDTATNTQHVLTGTTGNLANRALTNLTYSASAWMGEPWGIMSTPPSFGNGNWGGGMVAFDYTNFVSNSVMLPCRWLL